MKREKAPLWRTVSVCLAISMLFTFAGPSAWAARAEEPPAYDGRPAVITRFEALSETTVNQNVKSKTPYAYLNLPDTLTVEMRGTENGDATPDYRTAKDTVAAVRPAPNYRVDQDTAVTGGPKTVLLEAVEWTLSPERNEGVTEYDEEAETGAYVFTPVLPSACSLAEGVELPEINVLVGEVSMLDIPAKGRIDLKNGYLAITESGYRQSTAAATVTGAAPTAATAGFVPYTGPYLITQTGTAAVVYTIRTYPKADPAADPYQITLDQVYISVVGGSSSASFLADQTPISIRDCKVDLILADKREGAEGDNKLIVTNQSSGSTSAIDIAEETGQTELRLGCERGFEAIANGEQHACDADCGSLVAQGGYHGGAIAQDYQGRKSMGDVTVMGGNLDLIGGDHGGGIGTSCYIAYYESTAASGSFPTDPRITSPKSGKVTINGGTVTAYGGMGSLWGTHIPGGTGGFSKPGSVIINGGSVLTYWKGAEGGIPAPAPVNDDGIPLAMLKLENQSGLMGVTVGEGADAKAYPAAGNHKTKDYNVTNPSPSGLTQNMYFWLPMYEADGNTPATHTMYITYENEDEPRKYAVEYNPASKTFDFGTKPLIKTNNLNPVTAGKAFSQTFEADSGTVAAGTVIYWRVKEGSLPDGLAPSIPAGYEAPAGTPQHEGWLATKSDVGNLVKIIVSGTVSPAFEEAVNFTLEVDRFSFYGGGEPIPSHSKTYTAPLLTAPSIKGDNPHIIGGTKGDGSHTFTADGTAPIRWSIGTVTPASAAITMDSTTGRLSWTSAVPEGDYTFSVTATNDGGADTADTHSVTLKLRTAPVIDAVTLPDGLLDAAYADKTFAASNVGSTYRSELIWSVSGQPAGMSIGTGTAIFGGTPTEYSTDTTDTFPVKVSVKSSITGDSDTKEFPLLVWKKPVITSGVPSERASLGETYTHSFRAEGTGPLSWQVVSGALPGGLSLNQSTGVLSGTPSAQGNFTFGVAAKNNAGTYQSTPQQATLKVRIRPVITTGALGDGVKGEVYTQTLSTNVAPAYQNELTWRAEGLPNGLRIDPASGAITGTPTVASQTETAHFPVRVIVKNAAGIEGEHSYTLRIWEKPQVTTNSLTAGVMGKPYQFKLSASGTAPFTWTLAQGSSLPSGLALQTDGTITGTPAVETAHFTFHVNVSNGEGSNTYSNTKQLTLTVNRLVEINEQSLPKASKGYAFETDVGPQQFTAAAGTNPITWRAEGLPEGMTLTADGWLRGAPTNTGDFIFRVYAANPAGETSRQFVLNVLEKPVILTGDLTATYGMDWSCQLEAEGTRPLQWSIIAGSLPDGLTMTNTGVIQGKSTVERAFPVTVKAENEVGMDIKSFTIWVKVAPKIITEWLPDGKVHVPYGQRVTATGTPDIAYSASGLPDGLSMDSATGKFVGSASEMGIYFISVRAHNGASPDDIKTYKLTFHGDWMGPVPDTRLTISSGSNGTVSPNGVIDAELFEDFTILIEPEEGYEVDRIEVDGVELVNVDGNRYTFRNVAGAHSFHVLFRPLGVSTSAPVTPSRPETTNPQTGDANPPLALIFAGAASGLLYLRRKWKTNETV